MRNLTDKAGGARVSLALGVLAMMVVVASSNFLVTKPIGQWLTWAALTYPFAFLVTDVMNRLHGPAMARRVIWAGFACAVVLSVVLATPRIAFASGTAFLCAQLLDVGVFNRLREGSWWKAPLAASLAGGALDSLLFWVLAFAGATGEDAFPGWPRYGLADWGVKMLITFVTLIPFRLLTAGKIGPREARRV
ncbi:VUT family protein [Neomegalonema perideroedes]|uniref:VUT family protein n=1 Tax=Neomegalonema perideroedes TaxID=217219 RepID=UPI000367BC1F|nr:VUT family protein [Neomegalonema perideroedes]